MGQETDSITDPAPAQGRVRRVSTSLSSIAAFRQWTLVITAFLSAAAGFAEAVVLALISQIAVDMSSPGADPLSIGPIAMVLPIPLLLTSAAVLAVARLILQVVLARLPARLSGEVQTLLRAQLLDAFLASEWPRKAQQLDGHLQELMGNQTVQAGNAILNLATGLSSGLMFLVLAGSAFALSPPVAVGVMATAIALFACLRPLSTRVRRSAARTSDASLSLGVGVAQTVRLAEPLQVFGVETQERSRLNRLIQVLEGTYVHTRTLTRVVPVIYQGLALMLIVAGLAVVYAWGIGAHQLAALGAVVLLLIRASSYGQQLQVAYQGIGESLPYLERLIAATSQYRSGKRSEGHHEVPSIETIQFESVSFSYGSRAFALSNVAFSIERGEAIGVAGPSGAGKSTLVHLLLRLREPTKGRYLVNGKESHHIAQASWNRNVSYLSQEPSLMDASVSDNIRFFRDWLTDEAVERAARLAHIHEEVMSWPEGYSTALGQRVDSLSVGERQRLCLARALAGDPLLLILDEPTSSLDSRSEHLIQQSLKELRGRLTLILVAHRLTTLEVCDRIMVIQGGRLEAFGPSQLLYESNEFYRRATDLATVSHSA